MSNTFLPFCKPGQAETQPRKIMLHDISEHNISYLQSLLFVDINGMGRTWTKFSTLPAKKHRKFETATGKQTFGFNH